MKNEDKIILHLCARVGSDSKPYADAGYDVRIIGEDIGVENYNPPENVYGIIANPPCTMFSLARTTAKTPRDFNEGMRLVKECLRVIWEARIENKLRFWVLENPRAILRQFLGVPPYTFKHWEFGDRAIKPTDLWGYFNHPAKKIKIKPVGLSKQYPCGSYNTIGWGSLTAEQKSMCSQGFAKAFFEANK